MTWGRRLDQAGYHSAMYGKMDFCGEYQDGGFSESKIAIRRPAWGTYPRNTPWAPRLPGYKRPDKREWLVNAGPSGDVTEPGIGDPRDIGFFGHDLLVKNWAVDFLKAVKDKPSGKPWALYVGLLYPHWPFRVPGSYFDLYFPDSLRLPNDARFPNPDIHPALRHFQDACDFGTVAESTLRRTIAAYQGMITAMDEMLGEIIKTLKDENLYDDTYIIYTSDHGESLGDHGLFYKQSSYEGSVGVPLIVRGPGIAAGRTVENPVSLVDMYPTIMEMAGLDTPKELPGESWLPLARVDGSPSQRRQYVFSEFHGNFFHHAWYMLVKDGYKYTYYVNDRPTLFDLRNDPTENVDLATDETFGPILKDFETLLRTIVDPETVDREAKKDLGLLGTDGTDYTQTLTVDQLNLGIERGDFPAEPEKVV